MHIESVDDCDSVQKGAVVCLQLVSLYSILFGTQRVLHIACANYVAIAHNR